MDLLSLDERAAGLAWPKPTLLPTISEDAAPLFSSYGKANEAGETEASLQALEITRIPQCSAKCLCKTTCQAWRSLGLRLEGNSIFWYFLLFLSPALPSPAALSVQRHKLSF